MNWPKDDRDEILSLSRQLAEAHFEIQGHLVEFHIEVAYGDRVTDTTYSALFRAIGRMQRLSIDLRIALVSYRTTGRMPAVQEGGSQ